MAQVDKERVLVAKQIRAYLNEILNSVYSDRQPIGPIEACVTGPGKGPERAPKSGWKPFAVHERWGGFDQTTWFRMKVRIPKSMEGQRVVALVRPGGESLAYLNGAPFQGLDNNHDEVYLTEKAKGGETLELALESVPSVRFDLYHHFEYADLAVMHPMAWDFYWDCWVVLEVYEQSDKNYAPTRQLLELLNRCIKTVDLQHVGQPAYFESLSRAQRSLRTGLKAFELSTGLGKLIVTGQSHIDTAWLWPLRETRRKCGRTFSTVLNLLDRYPEFVFMGSQPAQYEYIQEHHPELFERIKAYVKKGRWEPMGGMYVETDCNVPSGESFVRQFLFGNRFFRREFGVHSRTAWLPDTFGDSWALPQILKKSQIDMFVTTKISWNEFTRFPYSFFQWQGTDGTQVPCLMPPLNYNGMLRVADVIEQWKLFHEKDKVDELPYPVGYGDGGGGPTMTMIETGKRLQNIVGMPKCEFGRMQDSLDRMMGTCDMEGLPVWNGELYLELHRGCQTTQARTKRYNRKCELLLRDAEILSSMALVHGGAYDQDRLNRAWKTVLINQFHDILPGSSITEVYTVAEEDYAAAQMLAASVREEALDFLTAQIAAPASGAGLIVFNTLPWARTSVARARIPEGTDASAALLDAEGRPVPSQRIGEEILFLAPDMPPMGYATFTFGEAAEEAAGSPLKATASMLENDLIRVRLDKKGRVTSLYDKLDRRELIPKGSPANDLQLFEDRPGKNNAWDIDFNFEERMWEPGKPESIELIEAGPVRAVVRVVRRSERSTISQDITLHAHSARLDFVTQVEWDEKNVLLKAAFPVDIHSSRAAFEIQFGTIERSTHRNTDFDRAQFEVTGHKWADLSEADYGVSLLNDCKYGYDVKGNMLRLSLLRSSIMPDPHADEGHHEFTYSVFPHAGAWQNGTVEEGYDLNVPLLTRCAGPVKKAALPSSAAFVEVDQDGVVIDTIKRCEDSNELIIRLYEAYGRRGEVAMRFGRKPKSVVECDLMEENDEPVKLTEDRVDFYIKPFEVRTFKVSFARS